MKYIVEVGTDSKMIDSRHLTLWNRACVCFDGETCERLYS